MMRLCIFIFLYFGVGALNAQSYFNNRYASNIGWGSVVNSIVLSNDSLFFNVFNVNDTTGTEQNTFSNISLTNESISSSFNLVKDDTDYFLAKLTPCSHGGFADVMTIVEAGKLFTYGVIKYKPNGDTAFFNVNHDSVLYIYIYSIKETNDKGFILSGKIQLLTGSQGGTEDLILIKTDSLGNEQWRKIYGLTDRREQGHSVALCNDGGYIVSGVKGRMAYVLKTDSLGNVEWDNTYGHDTWVNKPAYSIIQTQDDGYAFVGAIAVEHFTGADDVLPWVVKINTMGDTLWTNINTGISKTPYDNNFKDLIELDDGSIVICGQQRVENLDTINYAGTQRTKGVVAKYTPYGTQKWVRYYNHPDLVAGISSEHILNSIVQTPDGGFAAGGYLIPDPPDTGTQDTWVVKVDSFGCLEPGCELVSVPKIESSIASFKIYPNPASAVLNVEITPRSLSANIERLVLSEVEVSRDGAEMIFELYDILGKRVLSKTLQSGQNTLNIQQIPSGVYTYKIGATWGQVVIN